MRTVCESAIPNQKHSVRLELYGVDGRAVGRRHFIEDRAETRFVLAAWWAAMVSLGQPTEDPFDTVRSQASKALAVAEARHAKWGEERRRKPVRHDECKLLLSELLSSLEAAEADLDDLEEVIGVVKASRSRFPQLDDAELASRENFVRSSKRVAQSASKKS